MMPPPTTTWYYDPRTRRYHDNVTHRFLAFATVEGLMEKSLGAFHKEADALSALIADKAIPIGEWEAGMRNIIQRSYEANCILARGGLAQVTDEDRAKVSEFLEFQFERLDRFAGQITDEHWTARGGAIRRRARMYVNSGRQIFWFIETQNQKEIGGKWERWVLVGGTGDEGTCADCIALSAKGWVEIGTLPQPCDGSTACLSSCRCGKRYSKAKKRPRVRGALSKFLKAVLLVKTMKRLGFLPKLQGRGGPNSGYHAPHKGRPEQVGGSLPRTAGGVPRRDAILGDIRQFIESQRETNWPNLSGPRRMEAVKQHLVGKYGIEDEYREVKEDLRDWFGEVHTEGGKRIAGEMHDRKPREALRLMREVTQYELRRISGGNEHIRLYRGGKLGNGVVSFTRNIEAALEFAERYVDDLGESGDPEAYVWHCNVPIKDVWFDFVYANIGGAWGEEEVIANADNAEIVTTGMMEYRTQERGGPGSGHHGHAGRPGQVGGSAPRNGFPPSLVPEGFDPATVATIASFILSHHDAEDEPPPRTQELLDTGITTGRTFGEWAKDTLAEIRPQMLMESAHAAGIDLTDEDLRWMKAVDDKTIWAIVREVVVVDQLPEASRTSLEKEWGISPYAIIPVELRPIGTWDIVSTTAPGGGKWVITISRESPSMRRTFWHEFAHTLPGHVIVSFIGDPKPEEFTGHYIERFVDHVTGAQQKRGGPGSGHHGHKGRPGQVGGSVRKDVAGGLWAKRKTVAVSAKEGTVYVDEGIAPLVTAFNEAGFTTSDACSGHTGSKQSLESTLSFRHVPATRELAEALKRAIEQSPQLGLAWVVRDKGGGWHELYLEHGFYGDKSLPSSEEMLRLVKTDFAIIAAFLRRGVNAQQSKQRGGPGSGYHAPHKGRPGEVGGSLPREEAVISIGGVWKNKKGKLDWEPGSQAAYVLSDLHTERFVDIERALIDLKKGKTLTDPLIINFQREFGDALTNGDLEQILEWIREEKTDWDAYEMACMRWTGIAERHCDIQDKLGDLAKQYRAKAITQSTWRKLERVLQDEDLTLGGEIVKAAREQRLVLDRYKQTLGRNPFRRVCLDDFVTEFASHPLLQPLASMYVHQATVEMPPDLRIIIDEAKQRLDALDLGEQFELKSLTQLGVAVWGESNDRVILAKPSRLSWGMSSDEELALKKSQWLSERVGPWVSERMVRAAGPVGVNVMQGYGRANYHDETHAIMIDEAFPVSSAVHEYMHHIENTRPLVRVAAIALRANKTASGRARKRRIGGEHWIVSDDWLEQYAGRMYWRTKKLKQAGVLPDRWEIRAATEITSVGAQWIASPKGKHLRRKDPDHYHFALAVLMGLFEK